MNTYLCICDDEWCWCEQRVPGLDQACADCRNGQHVSSHQTMIDTLRRVGFNVIVIAEPADIPEQPSDRLN